MILFLAISRRQLFAALAGSGINSGFVFAPFIDGDFTVRAWQICALLSPGFWASKKQGCFFGSLFLCAAGWRVFRRRWGKITYGAVFIPNHFRNQTKAAFYKTFLKNNSIGWSNGVWLNTNPPQSIYPNFRYKC